MNPFSSVMHLPQGLLTPHHTHLVRRLSALEGLFNDRSAYEACRADRDPIVYEVYEIKAPENAGELQHGVTIVHPGKVGNEYFITKGHFHHVLETAEIYLTLRGRGFMIMETPEGDWAAEELVPDSILYIPPRWAHRSVNVGTEDLVMFFTYPGNAGHDYATIEKKGFRKLIIEDAGIPKAVDNPRWDSD